MEQGGEMTDKETYTMQYTCSNCGTSFDKKIPKGKLARGNGGKCPYCETEDKDWSRFTYQRPFWLIQAEGMRNIYPTKNGV